MFYTINDVKNAFEHIGELKNTGGYLFSGISTMIFGGIIPYLITLIKEKFSYKDLLFILIYWFVVGIVSDLLYSCMNLIFGTSNDVKTVVKKVLVDQFVWNPVLGVHTMIIPYYWRDVIYSCSKLKKLFSKIYIYKFVSTMMAVWIVWIPCVSAIYSMPSNLQIPLFNIVILFYSIILQSLSSKTSEINKEVVSV